MNPTNMWRRSDLLRVGCRIEIIDDDFVAFDIADEAIAHSKTGAWFFPYARRPKPTVRVKARSAA